MPPYGVFGYWLLLLLCITEEPGLNLDLDTGDLGGKMNILGGDSIGHCEGRGKKSYYEHVSTSEWLPRQNCSDVYWTVHLCDNWRIRNELDATYYFIVLLIRSTCFGHYCAHHQELATMMLITTLVGHYSSLTAPNLQHTANQERNDQCGNQHHSRELLMMGTVMPDTCWAYMKYNKIKSGI